MKFNLSPQCRMMRVCGIDIIGNPDTGTIIGLDEKGMSLVRKMQLHEDIDTSCLNDNQSILVDALSTSGFFSNSDHVNYVSKSYLHVTSHCNLKCPGCYSYEPDRNYASDLTLDELKRILDNLVKAGLTHLIISGGEPFIRDDIIDFLEYARSKQQIQYLECITNGTAPFHKYLEAVGYLDNLSFSLDSANAESAMIRTKEAFNKTVENIVSLKSENAPVSIVFTIHHGNVLRCRELISFASKLNVGLRFSVLTAESFQQTKPMLLFTPQDYQTYYDFVMSENNNVSVEDGGVSDELGCVVSCGAGKSTVSISSDGTIYPCHMFVNRKQFALGNALSDSIYNIINCPESNPFYSLNVDSFAKCSNCHVRYICGGGCRFRAYTEQGRIDDIDPMCKLYMDNFEKCILKLASQFH